MQHSPAQPGAVNVPGVRPVHGPPAPAVNRARPNSLHGPAQQSAVYALGVRTVHAATSSRCEPGSHAVPCTRPGPQAPARSSSSAWPSRPSRTRSTARRAAGEQASCSLVSTQSTPGPCTCARPSPISQPEFSSSLLWAFPTGVSACFTAFS